MSHQALTGILMEQKFISDCRYRVIESSSLVSVLFREVFSHPYISFFYLIVNGFCVTSFRTFLANCYELSISIVHVKYKSIFHSSCTQVTILIIRTKENLYCRGSNCPGTSGTLPEFQSKNLSRTETKPIVVPEALSGS